MCVCECVCESEFLYLAKVFGVEQETQNAAFDVHATVRELCGRDKCDGVR